MTSRPEAAWLDLVADLMSAPLTAFPEERVSRLFVETFDALGSGFYDGGPARSPRFSFWPPEHYAPHLAEITHYTVHDAPTRHPLLRYYLATGDARSMQVADVPSCFADHRVIDEWRELGRRWGGVGAQVSVPVRMDGRVHRAFVVGRADTYTEAEMLLIHRLQRLLSGLDRQVTTLSRWSARAGPGAIETSAAVGLTARELAVLHLLDDGLTAAAIGRRLGIAERTVQKHLQRCYAKLGVADRLCAVRRARLAGLLGAPVG